MNSSTLETARPPARVFALIVFCLLWVFAAAAQQSIPAPTALEIIGKYEKAVGKEAYKKLSTRTMRASVEIPTSGAKGTITSLEKAPDRVVIEVRIEGMGTYREGYDGKVAWSEDAEGVKELSGAEREQSIRDAEFLEDVNIRENFPDLKFEGKMALDGREAYVIIGKSPTRGTEKFYFDSTSWLLVRRDIQTLEGEPATLLLFDYREIDGIKFPFEGRESASGMVFRVLEVRHNVNIDDTRFAKPSAAGKV